MLCALKPLAALGCFTLGWVLARRAGRRRLIAHALRFAEDRDALERRLVRFGTALGSGA
jgi:hypothetical protein